MAYFDENYTYSDLRLKHTWSNTPEYQLFAEAVLQYRLGGNRFFGNDEAEANFFVRFGLDL